MSMSSTSLTATSASQQQPQQQPQQQSPDDKCPIQQSQPHLATRSIQQEMSSAQQVRSAPLLGNNQISGVNGPLPRTAHNSQLRCYLCETPKQEYSLLHNFSEVVCRGCVNYEGPDRIERLINAARGHKGPSVATYLQQQQQIDPSSHGRGPISQVQLGGHSTALRDARSAEVELDSRLQLPNFSNDINQRHCTSSLNSIGDAYNSPVSPATRFPSDDFDNRSPTSIADQPSPKTASPTLIGGSERQSNRYFNNFTTSATPSQRPFKHFTTQSNLNCPSTQDQAQTQPTYTSTNYDLFGPSVKKQPQGLSTASSQSNQITRTNSDVQPIDDSSLSSQNLLLKRNPCIYPPSSFLKPSSLTMSYPYTNCQQNRSLPPQTLPATGSSSTAAMMAAAANLGNLLASAGGLVATDLRTYDANRVANPNHQPTHTVAYQTYLDESLRRALYMDQQMRKLVHTQQRDAHYAQQRLYSAPLGSHQYARYGLEQTLEPDTRLAPYFNQNYLHSLTSARSDNIARHNTESTVQNGAHPPITGSDSQHSPTDKQLEPTAKRPAQASLLSPLGKRVALSQANQTSARYTLSKATNLSQEDTTDINDKAAIDSKLTSEKQEAGRKRSSPNRDQASPETMKQRQSTGMDDHNSASNLSHNNLNCLICCEPLDNRHFVQCPSVIYHKFCFACTKVSIQQQKVENGTKSKGSEEDKSKLYLMKVLLGTMFTVRLTKLYQKSTVRQVKSVPMPTRAPHGYSW